ncbi:MAG: cytochrome c family protein [Rickettsiales bacterium]|jgi:cytochrome c|nr:cytochrome c family protein [Rickettsiales bacterium]
MSGLELNKIIASVLVAGLIGMVAGNFADILYHPKINVKPGYIVEVSETAQSVDSQEVEVEVDIIALLAKADVNKGAKLVKKCVMCHDFTKGGPNKIGPNMWNIVNNKKGHMSGFAYSKALLEKGGTWTYEDLYHMINKPKTFIPGTKMNFIGFKNPEDVADVIAYLNTLSDNPVPIQ